VKVVIALGSNLGDSQSILSDAITQIRKSIDVQAVSDFHETIPVGGPEQPNYLNAVLIANTQMKPLELIAHLQSIENNAGRVRNERWGPRILDLDLITYGDLVMDEQLLTLPHPRAHERSFVLAPWFEIDPQAVLPGYGKIGVLLKQIAG
jgi:2-amino-4-hydroxy-6-hydroxymethyldihydropteridine diphosphokinase